MLYPKIPERADMKGSTLRTLPGAQASQLQALWVSWELRPTQVLLQAHPAVQDAQCLPGGSEPPGADCWEAAALVLLACLQPPLGWKLL